MKDDPVFGLLHMLLSLLPGVVAFLLYWFFWPIIDPYAWILFYPAVFLSAWIGGLASGLLTTFALTTAIWWFFVPPRFSFAIERPISWLSILLAIAVGVLMSLLHGRLRAALQESQAALIAVDDLNHRLEKRVRERTDELVRTTASVQDSEARLAGIIESAMDTIVSVDVDHRIVLFNSAAEHMFKCAASDVIGQPLDRFIPTRFRAAHAKHIEGFGHTSVTSRSMLSLGELFALRSDGTEFPIEASISQAHVRGQQLFTVILRDITERKRSNEASAQLAAIIESSTDAIVGKNLQGIVTSWNTAAQQMFGYDASEMIGQSITRLIPQKRLPEEDRILTNIRRGERVVPFETFRRRKDGTLIAVSVTASPIRNTRGEVIGVSKVARDVTQRRQIEQSLHDSEERFHALFDSMLEGCQLIGFDWKYRYVNDSIVRHSRVISREALLGKTMQEVFPGLEQTEIFAVLERCMLQRISERRETLFQFPDGAPAWFEVSVQPSPEGIFILSIDITERKKTEEQLRERDERFRQIAESLPQLIWTCLPDGVCDFVSRQWEQYTGLPATEIVGGRSVGHVHPDDRAAVSEAWKVATTHGTELRVEYRLQRHDGVYHWFDTRATPLRDAEGNLVKWFGTNVDIEDQKRAQEMQLRSQKMEALGTLSGGIAHDFNNILLAIIGNTRLAIDDLPANHQALESLREIERASARAADLVRRILSFSRQEESKKTVIHLRPIIDEAVKLLRSTLPAMIELRSQSSPNVPATIADSGQVHQIIMNLATNAAHAIGPRPGVVEIDLEKIQIDAALARTTPGLHEGMYVRLSVCDNGSGMDKATQQRMFDPFFTTKPVGQGTGLGLSVVDGVMKNHDGAITVYSQPGKGTALRLYFPATRDPAESPQLQPQPIAAGHGQRILYVDDDEALVFLATRTLTRLGYQVTGCTDPRQAVEKFRAQPNDYDAVVTDLSMPAMPGTELVREMRAIRPGVPVVITSGYIRPEDQEAALQLGATALILKPNTIEELGRVLDKVFRDRTS